MKAQVIYPMQQIKGNSESDFTDPPLWGCGWSLGDLWGWTSCFHISTLSLPWQNATRGPSVSLNPPC